MAAAGQDDARHERQDAGWVLVAVCLPAVVCHFEVRVSHASPDPGGCAVPRRQSAHAADPCEALIEQGNAQIEAMRRHTEAMQQGLQELNEALSRAEQRNAEQARHIDRLEAVRAQRALRARHSSVSVVSSSASCGGSCRCRRCTRCCPTD